MTKLEELQNKPREKRTPLEQCIVDAVTLEDGERDGEIELMELAAEQLSDIVEYKNFYNEAAKALNTVNHKLSQIKGILMQETFQDAVKNDPDMTAEQKEYWLSQPLPTGLPADWATVAVCPNCKVDYDVEKTMCISCGRPTAKD
jgi:hypothetical protein